VSLPECILPKPVLIKKTIMLFFYIGGIGGLEEQHFELGIGTVTSEVYSLKQTKHVIYSFGIKCYFPAGINIPAYIK
jgi:hypothetical protein